MDFHISTFWEQYCNEQVEKFRDFEDSSVDPSTDSRKSLGILARLQARAWKILEEPNVTGRISYVDSNLMPPDLEGYPSSYGWHEHLNKHVHVCREPNMFCKFTDKSFSRPSTWVRTMDQ
jgi:hypothetical protein